MAPETASARKQAASETVGGGRFTIALAGNPNSGKTTIFNALTGARQHVGNYPGVTVEKKSGTFDRNGWRIEVVDLPGTYSLTAFSADELIARDFVVKSAPDMVVNVIDSSNLERNLYLALQFMEMGVPVLLCLNMTDEMEAKGLRLDLERFSKLTGCPAVQTVGHKGVGIDSLRDAVVALHESREHCRPLRIHYGDELERHLHTLSEALSGCGELVHDLPARWVAIKLLEGDDQVARQLADSDSPQGELALGEAERAIEHVRKTTGDSPEVAIAEHRYGHLAGIFRESVRTSAKATRSFTDRLDNVLTHRFFGLAILLAVLYGVYQFTFLASAYPVMWLENGFETLADLISRTIPAGVSDGQDMLNSLLIDGVIGGVGGVMGFLPWVVFLFTAVALIEDSGYMARIAFVLDRVLRVFGLHGKSVLALIVSGGLPGGCAAPGVLATRVLRSRRDRLATILVVPLLMCGAKIPVIALICAAFFPGHQGLMMFLYMLITWAMVMLAALLIKATVLRGQREPFVMELPPYRLPTAAAVLRHTWDRAWMYIKKAGTILLAVSVLLWVLMYFPRLEPARVAEIKVEQIALLSAEQRAALSEAELAAVGGEHVAGEQLDHSFAGRAGRAIEPITRHFGQNWRTSIALVGGVAAKEVVVSTLGTAYSLGEVDVEDTSHLAERIAAEPDWTPLSAFALGFFVLIYSPCVVTIVIIAREAGWRWAAFATVYSTVLGYVMAVGIFQTGRLLGAG